jgi:hypothetical protein
VLFYFPSAHQRWRVATFFFKKKKTVKLRMKLYFMGTACCCVGRHNHKGDVYGRRLRSGFFFYYGERSPTILAQSIIRGRGRFLSCYVCTMVRVEKSAGPLQEADSIKQTS